MMRQFKDKVTGTATVEYAIILPVIMLLLVGTAELSNAFLQFNNLTKALRGAAAYAADNAIGGSAESVKSDAELKVEITNIVRFGNIAGKGTPTMPGGSPIVSIEGVAGDLTISASWSYQPIFPLIPKFGSGADLDSGITLTASTVVRAL